MGHSELSLLTGMGFLCVEIIRKGSLEEVCLKGESEFLQAEGSKGRKVTAGPDLSSGSFGAVSCWRMGPGGRGSEFH